MTGLEPPIRASARTVLDDSGRRLASCFHNPMMNNEENQLEAIRDAKFGEYLCENPPEFPCGQAKSLGGFLTCVSGDHQGDQPFLHRLQAKVVPI